ncbi:transposable element Tcb2 transposase [Trichonephila clavipes]|uniref:Transposable element Tcb2 transposase n=1 Tax=Trichonephila clavipes TaxID=2585209 RepID=A0A8X6SD56_TRICX|nr:transposable element Tcb2 transposase [Trichonephila clavipes]
MAKRNHLDDFTRGRIIGKLKEGRSLTSLAEEFIINRERELIVLSRSLKVFQPIGTAVKKLFGDQPRITTAMEDSYIDLQSRRAR